MERQVTKKSNSITKEEKMEGVIEAITNLFKKELRKLVYTYKREGSLYLNIIEAFKYLCVLFSYLERNLPRPQHYSYDFHNYLKNAAEKLELIKDFDWDTKKVLQEIGEDNE